MPPGSEKGIWKPGDRLTHRFNSDLGPGVVLAVEGRSVLVEFPAAKTTLRLVSASDALLPLELRARSRARRVATGESVTIAAVVDENTCRLTDGRVVPAGDLWPLDVGESPIERLAHGMVDPVEDFANRLDALHLASLREAEGLGSFLGGRIRLFPHQLYTALRATRSDPVRWLLADEVGLGKTVEACLILNRLLRTGRADRTLIVAPETLTVQWLGELWRKYHQVFVLLDEKRLEDVAKDYGAGFNPFDAHRRVVVGLQTLVAHPRLTENAVASGIDLLIVDEAHHLKRSAGHPGSPEYRAMSPITALGRHVLLLTATPLEDDAHGFFRLLQLLRPDEFPEETPFEQRLNRGKPLPACTSVTRRADIGGLPPRLPRPVEIDDAEGWEALSALETAVRESPAANAAVARAKADRVLRALASGASLMPLLPPNEAKLRKLARRAEEADPRVRWIARRALRWKEKGEKTLIFVARRETLESLKSSLEATAQVRLGIFHEELSPGRRDIEVAQFRLRAGPSLLISTECGGEGRNFEFCTRLVLFDMPWSPAVVEQRIGRLDRIGRAIPVEIVFFRPPGGLGAAVARLYEAIGLFQEPLGGLDRELGHVESAIEEAALSGAEEIPPSIFDGVIAEARAARTRVQEAAYHELHRDPYRSEMAESILARVPAELDDLTEEVVLAACERLGLQVQEQRGKSTYAIEFGNQAIVDHLPGVAGGTNFLGTFDREEAVANETIDYFASGHPLVEGILGELDESDRGRVALLQVGSEPLSAERAIQDIGLLALYKDGARFDAIAVSPSGRERPEWAEELTRRPLRTRRFKAETWTSDPGWSETIYRLSSFLERRGKPVAVAAFRRKS